MNGLHDYNMVAEEADSYYDPFMGYEMSENDYYYGWWDEDGNNRCDTKQQSFIDFNFNADMPVSGLNTTIINVTSITIFNILC